MESNEDEIAVSLKEELISIMEDYTPDFDYLEYTSIVSCLKREAREGYEYAVIFDDISLGTVRKLEREGLEVVASNSYNRMSYSVYWKKRDVKN